MNSVNMQKYSYKKISYARTWLNHSPLNDAFMFLYNPCTIVRNTSVSQFRVGLKNIGQHIEPFLPRDYKT